MKVNELLGSLFLRGGAASGNSDAGATSQSRGGQSAPTESAAGSDAVKLGAGLSSEAADDANRAARIAQLKAQVEGGTYQVDRTKVAEAVYRELF